MVLVTRFTFIVERKKKVFSQHKLLMTSYLVTIATGGHWACLKVCARDEQTASENVSLSSRKILRKTLAWVASTTPHPHPLYVQGLRYLQNHKGVTYFSPSFSTYLATKFDIEILNIRVTRTDLPKSASNNTSLFVKHCSRILTHFRLFIINAGRWPSDGYRSIS